MKETVTIRIQRNDNNPNKEIVAASIDYASQMGHNETIHDSETRIHDSGYTFKYAHRRGSLD